MVDLLIDEVRAADLGDERLNNRLVLSPTSQHRSHRLLSVQGFVWYDEGVAPGCHVVAPFGAKSQTMN
ncbi:MAG: hypothetical protein U0936_19950 [Planctomycetaceae bacterium]